MGWWEDLGVLIEIAPVQEEPTEKRSDTDGEVLTFMRLQEKYKQVYQPHEIAAWWEHCSVLIEMAPVQEEHAASAIQDAFKEQQKHKEKKKSTKHEEHAASAIQDAFKEQQK